MDFESNLTMKSPDPSLYQAIKENEMEKIKLLLEDGRNLNDPVVITGPFAGYTALHIACMENNDDLVELLVNDYKVDVNVVAKDGTQPIHLACFYEPLIDVFQFSRKKLAILLSAKANINAELDQEMFSKHVKDHEWCPDFGNKMTISIFTVLSDKQCLTSYLTTMGANVKIKSITNKTLLMYIIEKSHWNSMGRVIRNYEDSEYINHRDNDGIPATHYFFHPKKYGNYRYLCTDLLASPRGGYLGMLLELGADMYALVNDDPATFLPNIAAYRGCSSTLEDILPFYTSMSLSKALYYATLPLDENLDYNIRMDDEEYAEGHDYLNAFEEERKKCIELILQDLINRLTFGLPVPEEEKQLMDKLIATDTEIKNFVDNYRKDFIQGKLKTHFIEVNDKKMSLFDFIMDTYDDKKLKLMVTDETLYDRFRDITIDHEHCTYFDIPVGYRFDIVSERLRLLKILQKISTLKKAIPLPYELILDIVEYLNNKQLDIFIRAFIDS